MRLMPLAALVLALAAAVSVEAAEPNPQILDAFARLDIDRIDQDARILTGEDPWGGDFIVSRDVDHPDHARALEYLGDRLAEIGLPVEAEEYQCRADVTCANLIVELDGEVEPEKIWMIGAHLDSTQYPGPEAPGAVDNASGVVVVIEALRVLQDYLFDQTIRFVLFDSEETSPMGSAIDAAAADARGDDIQVLVNLDLPGWRIPGVNAALSSSDQPSWPDLQVMNQLALAYPAGTGHIGVVWPENDSSDHASFWDVGYHAFIVGSAYDLTGWMHSDDGYNHLDVEQCGNVTRLVIAYLGEQAGIQGEPTDDDDDDDNNDDNDSIDDDNDDDDDDNDDDNDDDDSDDDDDDDDNPAPSGTGDDDDDSGGSCCG